MFEITTTDLNDILLMIYGRYALHFPPSRLVAVEKQVRERSAFLGLASCSDYLARIRTDPEELNSLVDGLTTKETYFFRLEQHFEALTQSIMPAIEERLTEDLNRNLVSTIGRAIHKPCLEIWSAACSTGEEAYSIGMAALEGLKYRRAWDLRILATDISLDALRTAAAGRYEAKEANKVPTTYRDKYMRPEKGNFVVLPELAEKLRFRLFNLATLWTCPDWLGTFAIPDGGEERIPLRERFQAIFCRNLLIYFDFDAQQRLIERLFGCLKPGGYLFTGDAEPLHVYSHSYRLLEIEGCFVYQKPTEMTSADGEQTLRSTEPRAANKDPRRDGSGMHDFRAVD